MNLNKNQSQLHTQAPPMHSNHMFIMFGLGKIKKTMLYSLIKNEKWII